MDFDLCTVHAVLDRLKPISLSSFRSHVQNMHDDRAKGFEAEYQVSYSCMLYAVCCTILPCYAVCCTVLPCYAVCCTILPCYAVCCTILSCYAVCCTILSCYAVCCTILPCYAVCCTVLPCYAVCYCSCPVVQFRPSGAPRYCQGLIQQDQEQICQHLPM